MINFKKLSLNKNIRIIKLDLSKSNFEKLNNDYDYIYQLAAILGVENVIKNPEKVLLIISKFKQFENWQTNKIKKIYIFFKY